MCHTEKLSFPSLQLLLCFPLSCSLAQFYTSQISTIDPLYQLNPDSKRKSDYLNHGGLWTDLWVSGVYSSSSSWFIGEIREEEQRRNKKLTFLYRRLKQWSSTVALLLVLRHLVFELAVGILTLFKSSVLGFLSVLLDKVEKTSERYNVYVCCFLFVCWYFLD